MARPKRIVPGPGRPTKYDEQKATVILQRMAAGETSFAACRALGLPDSTVGHWRAVDRNGFRGRYIQAFAARAAGFGEEMLDILDAVPPGADMATVTLARAKMDCRRWLASKLVPQYADTMQHHLSGNAVVNVYLPAKGSSGDGGRVLDGVAHELLPGPDSEDGSEG
jgi:hypothetical protein